MPFMTGFERRAHTKSLLEGIELGLELKFGAASLHLLPEIKQLTDVEVLRAILHAIKSATTVEELRRIWML